MREKIQFDSQRWLPIFNTIFRLATRVPIACVRMYSVSVVSLKIYLFVHLINSFESFSSSSCLNWMDWRQLSISHMYLWIFIQCHRPHSMSAFIYLLSVLCSISQIGCVYVRSCVCFANTYVYWFSFRGCCVHMYLTRIACYQTIDMIIFFGCTKANTKF